MLGIVTGVLLQDHEVRKTDFQQLPYHRIFIMLLLELNAPETVLEAINFQVRSAGTRAADRTDRNVSRHCHWDMSTGTCPATVTATVTGTCPVTAGQTGAELGGAVGTGRTHGGLLLC